jgi:porphobilinogen deaminase
MHCAAASVECVTRCGPATPARRAVLDAETYGYGVGQGALGVECRAGDARILSLVQAAVHLPTAMRCTAERAMMRRLEGGCQVPISVVSTLRGAMLTLRGTVLSLDGATAIEVRRFFSRPCVPRRDVCLTAVCVHARCVSGDGDCGRHDEGARGRRPGAR